MSKKRLSIKNLQPDTRYAVQVRAVTDEGKSTWSQKYVFRTVDDTLGGTRTPKAPVLSSFVVDGSGQFSGSWTSVTQNTDNSPLVVARYEVELFGWDGRPVVTHLPQTGATQKRSFSFAEIRSLFTGIPSSITMKVRTVNSAGTISPWSNAITATLPTPAPPRNPAATGAVDSVNIKWDAPVSMANVAGYRVFSSIGPPADFTMNNSLNLIYEGTGLSTTLTSTSYSQIHYFKIVSFSEAGMVSTFVTANAQPVSPFGPDTVPPLKPTLGNPVANNSAPGSPKATVTWTINETAPENQDIAGFALRWRRSGDTHWSINYFDKATRGGSVELPYAYTNYQFEISAYDWMGNYSDYAGTLKTLSGALAPPPQVTGVNSDARFDGLKLYWNASTSLGVINGGGYEIQVRNTNSFSGDVPDYTTGNTSIDLIFPIMATRHFRVRAFDTSGQKGPWSAVHSKTLPGFPEPAPSDGVAPTAAPANVVAAGGINHINVSWSPITNNDPVTYEVYMANFTAGATDVAITPANLVGSTAGTSMTAATLPNGDPLVRNSTYAFKVRAVDYDGAGPASTLGAKSGTTLSKVVSDDLGINLPGENLYYNSSFDVDSDGNGVADYWAVYSFPAVPSATGSLVAGRTGGRAQRITWTTTHSSFLGLRSNDASVLRPHTKYTLSFYGRSSGGTGFGLIWGTNPVSGSVVASENPTPSSTTWQRYVFQFVTAATVDTNNVNIVIQGLTSAGWIEIDDAQIEAGDMASAYKPGTVSIAKLATGRFSTADMIIATGGRIVSDTYLSNPNTGFLITDAGITIKDGQIDAKSLVAGSTITNTLFVGAKMTVATSGSIGSQNYTAPTGSSSGSGYRITSTGIDISSGLVSAGTLVGGTIVSPDIRVGAGGKITVDSTGSIQSNNYGPNTGWKISNTGIEMNDANSKINVNALVSGTLSTAIITIATGGRIQSSTWAAGGSTTPRWRIDETGLDMVMGTIIGSTIITDQIYSAQANFVTVSPGVVEAKKRFSINADGYAEFVGANVYGNTTLGQSISNTVQSGNYSPTEGWRIAGNGDAEFKNLTAKSGSANGTYIKLGNYVNPYASNQNWAVIAMHTTDVVWEPALLWTGFSGTTANGTGFLRISSPERNASSVSGSYINLSYNASTSSKSRIDLKATDIYMTAEDYWMGGGEGPVSFRIMAPTSYTDRRFQFIDTGGNKRIEFRLGVSGQNTIVALENTTTRSNLVLRAADIKFEIGPSSHNLWMTNANSANNRPILMSDGLNVGLMFGTGTGGFSEGNLQVRTMNGSDPLRIFAKSFELSSDKRFKKDISNYSENALSKIEELKIRTYRFRGSERVEKNVGVVAQELQKVLPDAVSASDKDDDRLFVDSYYLLSVAIAGIQELNKEVKELREEVERLK